MYKVYRKRYLHIIEILQKWFTFSNLSIIRWYFSLILIDWSKCLYNIDHNSIKERELVMHLKLLFIWSFDETIVELSICQRPEINCIGWSKYSYFE